MLILSCENSCQRQSNVVQLHFTALSCVHVLRWNGDGINYLCRLPRSTSHLHRCTFKRKKYRALITQQNETNTRRWILTTAFHFLISKRGALPAAAAFFFDASSTAAGAASAISTSSVLFSVLPAIVRFSECREWIRDKRQRKDDEMRFWRRTADGAFPFSS